MSMTRWFSSPRAYLLLMAITLVARVITALPVQQAGYMDASYAVHVAENLAAGRGFVEDILWNYLDQPAGLPHPSNLYWMPLPSILIAPFFLLLGRSYHVAQIPFILLSPIPSLLTFHLGRKVLGRDDYAWIAALFTVFSGFYMVYWVSPDNFTPFAVTAGLCLYAAAVGNQTGKGAYFVAAGVFAGLSHLARADGVLLLAVVPIALLIAPRINTSDQRPNKYLYTTERTRPAHETSRFPFSVLRLSLFALLGYLIIMTPWFVRNYAVVGTPYPSAGAKTLWLTSYDELFRYADDLSPARYWQWGILPILESKVIAVLRSLLVLSFADTLLFLTPFALIGLWRLRRRVEFLPFFLYGFILFWMMVLVFTFPSWRGTLLHSGIALLPFCSTAAAEGIDAAVRWVARRRRRWDLARAVPFFHWGAIALAVFLSFYIFGGGIFGYSAGGGTLLWNDRDVAYAQVAGWLKQNARPGDIVMAGDPVAFHSVSDRSAIVIPSDGIEAVRAAADRYSARYIVLDYDYPKPLKDLYEGRVVEASLTPVFAVRDPAGHTVTLYEVAQ